MGFCHTTLTVKDMDASLRFYTEVVGLPVDRRYLSGVDTDIAFLGEGETKVELICYQNQPEAVVGNGVALGFTVPSVPDKLDSLKGSNVPIISDIIQPNPHIRFFYVTDPDGFRVQFLETL
ncbi:VOC family protein [Clostridium minihomine]|uniref:VOC family protein n=1 Tax=Clostridium minihomine TaxID=2045012 RepID=UPI000C774235|nr:VOC family protein [Clostridium minihomine]